MDRWSAGDEGFGDRPFRNVNLEYARSERCTNTLNAHERMIAIDWWNVPFNLRIARGSNGRPAHTRIERKRNCSRIADCTRSFKYDDRVAARCQDRTFGRCEYCDLRSIANS